MSQSPNSHPLHQLALTAGAIGYLVEKYDELENDSKVLTPQTANHHANKNGTVRASLANNLLDAYINTLDPTIVRTVRDNKTTWKTWVSPEHHIRLTRGEPNLNTDRANAFNKGANTLWDDGSLFSTDILGGAPTDNLTYSEPENLINTWIRYNPTTAGSVTRCTYYSAVQGEDLSFSEEVSMLDVIARATELEQERPEWLALLYSQYEQFFYLDKQAENTSVFDGPEKVTPTELSGSEQAAAQDASEQEGKAG